MDKHTTAFHILILIIIVSIALYIILQALQDNYKWQHVRLLTMDERIKVVQLYGPSAAIYQYVVLNSVYAKIDGHLVTVPRGFFI